MPSRRAVPVWISVSGTLLVTAYAAAAALQILVLNPLAAVPGATLAEIHADMAAMDESPGMAPTIAILGFGVLLAGALAALFAGRPDATPFASEIAYLLLLVLGAPAFFVASFGPGMALADTYGIGGADHSPWAIPLYVTSGIALLALLAVIVVENARASTGTRAPAAG